MKTAYQQTSPRRRRKIFPDGSSLIVSSSGYELFEGVPKAPRPGRKAKRPKPTPLASGAPDPAKSHITARPGRKPPRQPGQCMGPG